jgi:hypothetical protein
MSIQVTCPKCKWETEYPEHTLISDMLHDCPVCDTPVYATAIADWLRGINPSAIGD